MIARLDIDKRFHKGVTPTYESAGPAEEGLLPGVGRLSISVVIPAYNAARFLRATLESVLGQSYPIVECIVVDDGSVDSTADIVGEFEDRVTLLSQTNQGVAAARNNGVLAATSEFIALCDADDVWRQDKLELQVRALAENPEASAALCGLVIVDAKLKPIDEPPTPDFPSLDLAALVHHRAGEFPSASASTMLVRRDALIAAGLYDGTLSDAADWDLVVRLRKVGPFVGTTERATFYRVHEGAMTRQVRLGATDNRRLFEKFAQDAEIIRSMGGDFHRARAWNAIVSAASLIKGGVVLGGVAYLARETLRNPLVMMRVLNSWLKRGR
jgi:glycosyltransferase involved in cell wall biosynthesis